MTEAIIAALIAAAASIFGSFLMYRKSSKDQIEKMARSEQRTLDRLEAIEKSLIFTMDTLRNLAIFRLVLLKYERNSRILSRELYRKGL